MAGLDIAAQDKAKAELSLDDLGIGFASESEPGEAEVDAPAEEVMEQLAAQGITVAEPAAENTEMESPKSKPLPPGLKMQLSALPMEELEAMLAQRTDKARGGDGSDGVFVRQADFEALIRNVGHKEDRTHRYKKLIALLLALALLLGVVAFTTSYAAAEIGKESHVTSGSMTDLDGNVVMTRSSDFEVCSDNTLAQPGHCQAAGGRRLQDSAASETVRTMPVKQRRALSSSMSDAYFMSLDEVAVFSDKGHTLRLQIHGFSRIPVLNSRCGNIVHLYTAWNGRLSLDSTDLSFDNETENAFANAGFSLAVGGVSGRRLAGDHSVDGFFSAVQGVAEEGSWTCQDVPLPSLPNFYSQQITVYRPCAVEGVTGDVLDMCDSKYGGVLPGTKLLERKHQLATMTKTERIRSQMSVGVPIEHTLFSAVEIETIKSSKYELQVSKFANHPGQVKVHLFDRTSSSDISFQLLAGKPEAGRFFCNMSGADEVTPQKKELEGEQQGIARNMHFELLDLVEEEGRMLRHFRMMPDEAFLDWMGAKPASARPKDSYYEYWDVAADMTPYRLLNPDGSLVVFKSTSPAGAADADVEAKLAALGGAGWAETFTCTDKEMNLFEATALDMDVPMMLSPMSDLLTEDFSFYAKLHLDEMVEAETGNGWESMLARSEGGGPLADFAKYALRSTSPVAMPDVCADICAENLAAVEEQLRTDQDLDLCDAPGLTALTTCLVDVASRRTPQCMKSNLMIIVQSECAQEAANRRLADGLEATEEEALDGSEEYLRRMGRISQDDLGKYKKMGETQQGQMSQLSDGSFTIDLDALDAAQRATIAKTLGVEALSGGRILFNATDSLPQQKVSATLEAVEQPGTVHSRRLMLDMNCLAPGVGPGCIFSVGYPWGCDPLDGNPKCKFGLSVKMQVGGPANGALSIGGAGCVEEWAFGVPKPFSGSVCVDGGISVSWTSACGLPFSLAGRVGLTAQVGLDLVLFSFSFASIRIEGGAAIENYKYNCDSRRRRRRGWGGRRRGADESCSHGCDIKVYIKGTFQVLVGRVWALAQYWLRHRNFDFILGADIYIWAVFTSWWETVAQVDIV